LLHQVGDLFELNVKLRCQKVNVSTNRNYSNMVFKKIRKDSNTFLGTDGLYTMSVFYIDEALSFQWKFVAVMSLPGIDTLSLNRAVTSLGNEIPSEIWKPVAVTSPVVLPNQARVGLLYKTGHVHINVTLRRLRATIVAVEKQ
jgi:hypothetical protein